MKCKCKWDGALDNGKLVRCNYHQEKNNFERKLRARQRDELALQLLGFEEQYASGRR